jgi:hypothetical protein
MNKKRLHHYWKRFKLIKPWYFLIIAAVSGVVCIIALRSNNEHMIKLRNAVYSADQNNTDVQKPLQELQAYVIKHMNTNLSSGPNSVYPPIQLKYTYDRLVKAQSDALAKNNTQIYTDAQHYCESLNSTDFSGHNRVPCIEQYVQSHNASQSSPIPDSLYKFAFISPTWSPDIAGWSMLVTIAASLLFVISFIANRWFKHGLK